MNVNSRLRELYPDSKELFDVVMMTNNHAQVGVRLINSINHHGINECYCYIHLTTNDFDLPSSKSITQSFFMFVSGLQIDSFCMTGGQSPIGYLDAIKEGR